MDYQVTSAKFPSTSSPMPSPNLGDFLQVQSLRSIRCLFLFQSHFQQVIEVLPFPLPNFLHWPLICVDAKMPFSYWVPFPYVSSLLPYEHVGLACGLCPFWSAPLSSCAGRFSFSILPLLNIYFRSIKNECERSEIKNIGTRKYQNQIPILKSQTREGTFWFDLAIRKYKTI